MAEDRDIKIYVGSKTSEQNDFQQLTDGIELNTQNGNIEKANKLGVRLAKFKPESAELGLDCSNTEASVLYCIRVLLTFTAEYTVQRKIASDIVSDAVSSAMYGYLKKEEPGYYANISDGSAFTFYLLALQKGGNIKLNIGEQFAERCGTRQVRYVELGERIFTDASEIFEKMIEETDFK